MPLKPVAPVRRHKTQTDWPLLFAYAIGWGFLFLMVVYVLGAASLGGQTA